MSSAMTKPTGRPRGRPAGSRNTVPRDRISDPDKLRQLAHQYFLRILDNTLSTCLAMGYTKTVDIKHVRRLIGQKLVAEANKAGYLHGDGEIRSDSDSDSDHYHDTEIDMGDGSDDDE